MRVSDAKRIPMFKPGTSRGPLVDYEDVVRRIVAGELAKIFERAGMP